MPQTITTIQPSPLAALPALFTPDARTAKRTLEFFTAQIRNPNTRRAYARAASRFSAWCAEHGLDDLQAIEPVHVAAYIEGLQSQMANHESARTTVTGETTKSRLMKWSGF